MVSEKQSISKEEWAKTLFGDRGVLTGIFQAMDQQRKTQPVQSDNPSTKVNGIPYLLLYIHKGFRCFNSMLSLFIDWLISGDFDFKKVFDSLLMGSANKDFNGPGPELPEVPQL